MSDWQRSTQECSYDDLAPAVQLSIADYAEKRDLGDIGDTTVFCAVTTSERKKLFGKRRQTTSIVVTPELLVWTVSEGGDATTVAARRGEIEIRDFESELVDDSGIEVFGFVPLGASERGTAFIGLGPELAAQTSRARRLGVRLRLMSIARQKLCRTDGRRADRLHYGELSES